MEIIVGKNAGFCFGVHLPSSIFLISAVDNGLPERPSGTSRPV